MRLTAIKVSQPLADFYITKIKASDLLNVSFSEQLQYQENGELKGSQRKIDDRRLKEIAKFIDSVEMSFPSSIIIAANYTEDGYVLENEDEERWSISHINGDVYEISAPGHKKLAAIIDGQHRLNAFNYAKLENKDIEVVCSIYFDLPNSYQAFLFATINGNQKKVDKSLALEQFGFNVENEPEKSWTPEKLSVFLSRKLNFREDSPLYKKIKLAPQFSEIQHIIDKREWIISTAALVEGILSLITSNPKRDRVIMAEKRIFVDRDRKMVSKCSDSSPLRTWYIENRDSDLYQLLTDYFNNINNILWNNVKEDSIILKTVGILALFDFLKMIIRHSNMSIQIDTYFYVEKISVIDYSDNFFSASGTGRVRMRKTMAFLCEFINESDLKDIELENIKRLLQKQ